MVRKTLPVVLCVSAGLLGSCASSDEPVDHAAAVGGYGSVPSDARCVAYGPARLEFTATEDGRVWVGDEAAKHEVVSRKVARGDRVVVVADAGRVELNNRVIEDQGVGAVRPNAIYFLAAGARSAELAPYDGISMNAARVAGGQGKVEWRATQSGRVWVGDDATRRLLVSEPVAEGDVVEIDVENDRITVNGRTVCEAYLEPKHAHAVFFR